MLNAVSNISKKRQVKAPIRKPCISKYWDDQELSNSIMEHQFDTIMKIAEFGGHLSKEKKTLSNEKIASHLIDESVNLHMYDNIEKLEWHIRYEADVNVRTAYIQESSNELVEGKVTVNASISQILSLLSNDDKRKAYDKQFGSYNDHRRVGLGTSLTSGRLTTLFYDGIWPVSGRKFVVLSAWKPHWNEKDKTLGLVFATRSISKNSVSEEDSNDVLAKINIAGFYISPHPKKSSDESSSESCDLTMISHIDFCGIIPARIINYVQTHVMPDILRTIRDLSPLESGDNTLYQDAVNEYKEREKNM